MSENSTDQSEHSEKKGGWTFEYLKERSRKNITSFFKNPFSWAFLGILFFGFLLRLKYINQESLWNDSAVHLWYAIRVAQEPLFFFSREYLLGDYTIPQTITSFFYLFTQNILLAGKVTTILYALLGIIFMYLLGKELKGEVAGILGAILLTFNHIVWFYGVRPLGDSPLLTTTIILLYCMTRLEKEKTTKWGVLSGILFIVAIFTKVQSMLFSLAIIIYILLFKRKEMFKEKGILYSWLIPVGFLLLAHILGKGLFGAKILDRVFKLFLDLRGVPFGFEALGMIQWIFSGYLLLFVVLGLIFVVFYKQKEYYFPLTLFFFYYLFFEINVDNTQDRYLLPLLSVGIILAVFALEEVKHFVSMLFSKKNFFLTYIFPLAVVFFLSWNYYQIGDPLIYNKTFSYTGYQEAGDWIKENVPSTDPIFAGEYRSIRFFSEREYGGPEGEDFGGNVINLRSEYRYLAEMGKTLEDGKRTFEEDVALVSQKRDVYLEIDVWEYAQPPWYWPLSQNSLDYFLNMGFKLVKVVEREILTKDGPKKIPVIFILKKEKTIMNNTTSADIRMEWTPENRWLQKFVS